MSPESGETASTTPTVVLGPVRLTGRSAAAFALGLLAGIIALLVHYRARIASTPLTISAVLWIAFVVYWNIAASGSAPSVRSESAKSRAFHQNAMWLSLLLLFVPIPWLDWPVLPLGIGWVVAGLALHAASVGVAVAARRALGRNWSGEIAEKAGHQLIRSGPYRFVRHPIYSAMLGMFVGTALVSGDAHALLGVVLMAAAYARKIGLEERNLEAAFGAAYADYRRTTHALIPWVF